MNRLLDFIQQINKIVPSLHEGLQVTSIDGDEITLGGSRNFSYHEDIKIICKGVQEAYLIPNIVAENIEAYKDEDGHTVMSIVHDNKLYFKVTSSYIEFESEII